MDFKFELIDFQNDANTYTDTCSGSRSDCCTRTCTNMEENTDNTNEKWADYFELNAGMVQY